MFFAANKTLTYLINHCKICPFLSHQGRQSQSSDCALFRNFGTMCLKNERSLSRLSAKVHHRLNMCLLPALKNYSPRANGLLAFGLSCSCLGLKLGHISVSQRKLWKLSAVSSVSHIPCQLCFLKFLSFNLRVMTLKFINMKMQILNNKIALRTYSVLMQSSLQTSTSRKLKS